MSRRRVAVAFLSQRSNAFAPVPTPLEAFRTRRLAFGPELVQRYESSRTVAGGVLQAARRYGWDLLPIVGAWAPPGGPCTAAAYDHFRRIILIGAAAACSSTEGLDGVVLGLSGSMVVEGERDPAGDLALAVRSVLGRRRPLVVVLDFLANATARLVAAADACIGCETNPPNDGFEQGSKAAMLVESICNGEIHPVQHLVLVPLLAPPYALRTALPPMADLVSLCRAWEQRPGVVNVWIGGGFPYVDVPEAGLSVIALADGDPTLAHEAATAVARAAYDVRHALRPALVSPEQALASLRQAVGADPRPVVLTDLADDPGAGAAGDVTDLLRAFLAAGRRGGFAATFCDPETVSRAVEVGVGGQAIFAIGGRADPQTGPPLRIAARVRRMGDGEFASESADGRGAPRAVGRCALLDLGARGGLLLAATEQRPEANDAGLFRHLGVDPSEYPVLLSKGIMPQSSGWTGVFNDHIAVATRGWSHPDLTRLPFRRVRRPIYPLDPL